MSKEKGAAKQSLSSEGARTGTNTANLEQQQRQHPQQPTSTTQQPQQAKNEATTTHTAQSVDTEAKPRRMEAPSVATGAPVVEGSPTATTVAESTSADSGEPPRQVIAVSASKSPAAFFNLARKFLVTNEMCDLSALEGAIVSAVDAAHLLERSQLATIVRIHTSYVSVEPKRKKQPSPQGEQDVVVLQPSQRPASSGEAAAAETSASTDQPSETQNIRADDTPASSASSVAASAGTASPQPSRRGSSGGRELRRARIVVTVRRTENYKRWLEENPLQAIIASEADEEAVESDGTRPSTGRPKKP